MENDELMDFARILVQAKAGQAGADEKEVMAQELRAQIEDVINHELLSRMTGEQIIGFNELLSNDSFSPNMIIEFVEKCDIDITNVTTVALAKVKQAYLGA